MNKQKQNRDARNDKTFQAYRKMQWPMVTSDHCDHQHTNGRVTMIMITIIIIIIIAPPLPLPSLTSLSAWWCFPDKRRHYWRHCNYHYCLQFRSCHHYQGHKENRYQHHHLHCCRHAHIAAYNSDITTDIRRSCWGCMHAVQFTHVWR